MILRVKKKIFTKLHLFQSKVLLICLFYGFTGMNFLVSSIFWWNPGEVYPKLSIMLGVVMLSMVPISFFDNRKEMRGTFNLIVTVIIHFVFSIWLSWIHLSWSFLILYVCEVVVALLICCTKLGSKDRKP